MSRGGKAAHIDADLRDDGLGGLAVDARDGLQVRDVPRIGCDRRGDALAQPGDARVQEVDVVEEIAEQRRVMRGEATGQGRGELRTLLAQGAPRELREDCAVPLAAPQGAQHGAARSSEDVRGDQPELDVGRLQELPHAVRLRGPLLNEELAVAREIAQLADGLRRDEARAQQPVLQQLREPLAVANVGLPSRDGLEVLGVHQDHLAAALEEVEHGLPQDPRALHRDVRDALLGQPLRKSQELGRGGAERAHLTRATPALARAADTGDDRGLVDIEPATARIEDLHDDPPLASAGRWSRSTEFPQRAAHRRGRNNVRCLTTTRVIFQASSGAPFRSRPSPDPTPGPAYHTPLSSRAGAGEGLMTLPVHAGALHRDVGDLMRGEPVAQGQEVCGRRAEGMHVLASLAAGTRHPYARRHGLLVHVQARAPLQQPFHKSPPSCGVSWPGGASCSRLCSACSKQQCGVPEAPASDSNRTRGTMLSRRRPDHDGTPIPQFRPAG